MRALQEPDAIPAGDVALRSALKLNSTAELLHRAEAWRPWRSYATMYVLRMGSGIPPRKRSASLPNPERGNRRLSEETLPSRYEIA